MSASNISAVASCLGDCLPPIEEAISDPSYSQTVAAIAIVAFACFKSLVNYCYSDVVIKKWTTAKGNELSLLRKDADLYWVLWNKTKNKTYRLPATNDILNLETYAKDANKKSRKTVLEQAALLRRIILEKKDASFNQVEWLRNIPIGQRISFFTDNDLKEVTTDLSGAVNITLQLFALRSIYDPNLSITRDHWAVTVLCRGDKNEDCCYYGHSVLAYEGVVGRNRFVHYAHLVEDNQQMGFGKVLPISRNSILDPKFTISQSKTWIRTSFQVVNMIEQIESDIALQEKKKLHAFDLLGGSCIYILPRMVRFFLGYRDPVQVNCHTWVVFTLMHAGIDARSFLGSFAAVPILEVPLLRLKNCYTINRKIEGIKYEN